MARPGLPCLERTMPPEPSMSEALNDDFFPQSIVRDAVGGCCHDFAIALHRRTGWPLAAIWRHPVNDGYALSTEPVPVHLFCIEPGGRAIDAEGLRNLATIRRAYARDAARLERLRVEIHGDETAWVAVAAEREEARCLAPCEHGIAAAEAVISGSEAFQALLERLASPLATLHRRA